MLPGCSCTKPARLSSAVAIPGVLLPALASAAGQLEDAALLFRSNTLASPASILTSRWQPNRSHNKQCWCVGPPHTLQQLAGRGRHPAPCYFGCMGLHGVQASMGFCMGLHGVAWGCMGLRGVHGQTAHGLDIVCVPTAGAMLVRRSVSVRVAAAGRLARLE